MHILSFILGHKKITEGANINVVSLDVEENGTYSAPSGKAYSPVNVNVPKENNSSTYNGSYSIN